MSKKCKLDVTHLGTTNKRVLTSMAPSKNNENNIDQSNMINIIQLESPVKPDSDKKEYTTIQLPNGLKALLISDESSSEGSSTSEDEESVEDTGESGSEAGSIPEVTHTSEANEKLAACSLTVGVGSFSDPINIQGLAHFLEHMLFMGSEKYPKENEFDAFIKKKGGSDNATTECEYTTFYFECQEKYLLTAMDIFSNFFIAPLLKKEAMTREREAVESEFQMALPSDNHRREQLISSMAHEDNPAKKFTWGNQVTLRDSVKDDELHKAVWEFWRRHYSAHRMTLAVQGRLPMETLKEYVIKCFSGIPNNSLPPLEFPRFDQPFIPEKFNKFYRAEAVQDMFLLEVNWALPPVIKLYKSKPLGYLSWIIGHEGEGSLTSYLRKKLWASGLSSGHSDGLSSNSIYTLFSITMILSDAGKTNVNEILKAIFSYIKMLQIEGPSERIFKEVQAINEIDFRFSEEESAVDNVESLSENMQFYPPIDYITGSELTFEYKPDEISQFLNMMTPENANIILNAHNPDDGVPYDHIEPWFKTKYTISEISNELMNELKNITPYPEFHLPKPNEFIPTDFSLLPEDTPVPKYPQWCLSTDVAKVYYRPDMKFRLPIGFIGLHIVTPMLEESKENSAMVLLYLKMLQVTLVEKIYPASMASLEHNITPSERGLSITVYGFSHKLNRLLECIADGILNFNNNITEELFETYKKMTHQMLTNLNLKVRPLSRDIRMSLLLKKYWTSAEKYRALSDITLDDLKYFSSQLFKEVRVHCLVQGNFTDEQAKNMCLNFIDLFKYVPLSKNRWPKILVYQLPLGEKCCRVKSFNYGDKNSLITNYYQYGPATIREYSLVELLLMLMEEPLFDKLRTQEQLGYDVSCTIRDTFGILGFTVSVNSQVDKHSVDYVETRITEFLNSFVKTLEEMPDEEFNDTKQSLIKIKQCVDIHLKEEVKRNWSEIESGEYAFDRLEKEIKHITEFTKDEVIDLLKTCATSDKCRKLSVQIEGHEGPKDTSKKSSEQLHYQFLGRESILVNNDYFIKNIDAFKENLTLFPPSKIV
ncbi:hypothetical protein O3M35_003228 [Rhynocoris fuscipes]|uniref:Nardilysin n=1 Tax=Rhynocoris fuscipes TaxID=488301 RepID=A0AAW1CQ60_9HEMI